MDDQTNTFLSALWGDMPRGSAIQLWRKDTKQTVSFASVTDAAAAAARDGQQTDLYIAAGLAPRVVRPSKRRTAANDVAGIAALWADIDVNGGPEGKTGAAPDLDSAVDLARSLLEPTLIVASGYGIQAWWVIEDPPWIFSEVAEREQAMRLSMGFQGALRAQARDLGFNIDSTHDLARLMRLPGTLNHKGGRKARVDLYEVNERHHPLDVLTEIAHNFMQGELESPTKISIDTDHLVVPAELLMDLQATKPEFGEVLRRETSNQRRTWSDSEYDLSIASHCVGAGFTDQEIAGTIAYSRKRHSRDQSGKGDRPDYLLRTIAKARSTVREERQEVEADRVVNELDHVAATVTTNGSSEGTRTQTLGLFNKLIGGPEVKEVVQDSRDPEMVRFTLVLADGTEVPMGNAERFATSRMFRLSLAVATGHYMPSIKQSKWDQVMAAVFKAVTVREGTEDTRVARVLAWLDAYLDRRVSTDKDAACQAQDPFVHEDIIHVPLGPFGQWLRKVRGERVVEVDLKLMLRAAGFDRKTVNYVRDNGRKSSRSYFVAPSDIVEAA